jgi:membrane-associated PAP2 superfamily phosphatase
VCAIPPAIQSSITVSAVLLFSGFIFGWILGFYQMAKGAHFFGDTLVSMLLCFLVAAMIARFYFKKILYDQR